MEFWPVPDELYKIQSVGGPVSPLLLDYPLTEKSKSKRIIVRQTVVASIRIQLLLKNVDSWQHRLLIQKLPQEIHSFTQIKTNLRLYSQLYSLGQALTWVLILSCVPEEFSQLLNFLGTSLMLFQRSLGQPGFGCLAWFSVGFVLLPVIVLGSTQWVGSHQCVPDWALLYGFWLSWTMFCNFWLLWICPQKLVVLW